MGEKTFVSEWLFKPVAKLPVHVYRYAISPMLGPRCRHLPTCSQYALDAIDLNGGWAGGWLALARVLRCHPFGSSGYDPAPDLTRLNIPPWAPWRIIAAANRRRRARDTAACSA